MVRSRLLNSPSSISHPVHHRASNPYWDILPGWEGECSGGPAIVLWSKWLHGNTFLWVCLALEKTVSASAAWKTDNSACSHCNASTAWWTKTGPMTPMHSHAPPPHEHCHWYTSLHALMGQGDSYHQPTTGHNTHIQKISLFHSHYKQTNIEHSYTFHRNGFLGCK